MRERHACPIRPMDANHQPLLAVTLHSQFVGTRGEAQSVCWLCLCAEHKGCVLLRVLTPEASSLCGAQICLFPERLLCGDPLLLQNGCAALCCFAHEVSH